MDLDETCAPADHVYGMTYVPGDGLTVQCISCWNALSSIPDAACLALRIDNKPDWASDHEDGGWQGV